MFARHDNFPENFHEREYFQTSLSIGRTQQAFAQAVNILDREPLNMGKTLIPSISDCVVTLEIFIAEGKNFSDTEKEETRMTKAANSKPLQAMDFFCTIMYHKKRDGKKKPLRFDYYILRFIFEQRLVEARAFHERGPRRITPKEIIAIITDNINASSSKKILKPFEPEF